MKASCRFYLYILFVITPFGLSSQCSISNVQISNSQCGPEYGHYSLTIDFDYQNTSANFYQNIYSVVVLISPPQV